MECVKRVFTMFCYLLDTSKIKKLFRYTKNHMNWILWKKYTFKMNKEKWDYVQFVFLDFIGTYKRTNEIKNTRQFVFLSISFVEGKESVCRVHPCIWPKLWRRGDRSWISELLSFLFSLFFGEKYCREWDFWWICNTRQWPI